MPYKPSKIPSSPYFGSGPCKKHPGWKASDLQSALIGRSHRAPEGIAQIQRLLDLTREILAVPQDYTIAIVPGSGTGAVETALWNFLGSRPVDIFAWDVFGKLWVTDAIEQLSLPTVQTFVENFGRLPDLTQYAGSHDCVFTFNGTSGGVMVPHLDWIPDDRQGLTICDATSSAFVIPINDWHKLDITCFSWQKGFGGEAAHGMIIVSPRAMQHLTQFQPSWPIPRLFRLTKAGEIIQSIFEAKTINTPSMLCVEDAIQGLDWAVSIGGKKALWQRVKCNFDVIDKWVTNHPDLEHLAIVPESRSKASICFNLTAAYCGGENPGDLITQITTQLADLGVAYDIKNHFLAPSSFRIWCGPTIETADLSILTKWIDWSLEKMRPATAFTN
ncbi:phosphoserine transaminase [Candidatus Odyssella acanthamoebae]|uniref:phosphoserine transaminase n=1 Tax=Candidatus Odyssella acanthamoebae TaxID=91604 RepID=A0A077AUH2_9PROT|nr:phosphoserine transaminase [Candidatus Paracaedibacter acanthamoebae]AIK96832.1 phosphoserine aminotransferase [Candidatus Paracaedibacter acanthamoebae]